MIDMSCTPGRIKTIDGQVCILHWYMGRTTYSCSLKMATKTTQSEDVGINCVILVV